MDKYIASYYFNQFLWAIEHGAINSDLYDTVCNLKQIPSVGMEIKKLQITSSSEVLLQLTPEHIRLMDPYYCLSEMVRLTNEIENQQEG